jgi:hypothetical protein
VRPGASAGSPARAAATILAVWRRMLQPRTPFQIKQRGDGSRAPNSPAEDRPRTEADGTGRRIFTARSAPHARVRA